MKKNRTDAKFYLESYRIELERRNALQAAADQVNSNLKALLETIEAVPSAQQRAVLTMRYINGESLSAIARKINYSYEHTQRFHTQGLEAVDKILNT